MSSFPWTSFSHLTATSAHLKNHTLLEPAHNQPGRVILLLMGPCAVNCCRCCCRCCCMRGGAFRMLSVMLPSSAAVFPSSGAMSAVTWDCDATDSRSLSWQGMSRAASSTRRYGTCRKGGNCKAACARVSNGAHFNISYRTSGTQAVCVPASPVVLGRLSYMHTYCRLLLLVVEALCMSKLTLAYREGF